MTEPAFIGYKEVSGLGSITVLQVYQIGCARYAEIGGELRPLYVDGNRLSIRPKTEPAIELKSRSRANAG